MQPPALGSYQISQKKRPRIERAFGWMKSIGGIRKVKLRGLLKVDWLFLDERGGLQLVADSEAKSASSLIRSGEEALAAPENDK